MLSEPKFELQAAGRVSVGGVKTGSQIQSIYNEIDKQSSFSNAESKGQ